MGDKDDDIDMDDDDLEALATELLLLRTSNDTRGKELMLAAIEGWLCDAFHDPATLCLLIEDTLRKRRRELKTEEDWIARGAPRITREPNWAWRPDKQGR
jgi:hypothetical protein